MSEKENVSSISKEMGLEASHNYWLDLEAKKYNTDPHELVDISWDEEWD